VVVASIGGEEEEEMVAMSKILKNPIMLVSLSLSSA
jgi:hypothetical protein